MLPTPKALKLLNEMHTYFWQFAVRHLQDEVKGSLDSDAILAMLKKHGIRYDTMLLPDEQRRGKRLREKFAHVIVESLSRVAHNPADFSIRQFEELRLMQAYSAAMAEVFELDNQTKLWQSKIGDIKAEIQQLTSQANRGEK
jgi:hypothetical protein